MTAVHGVVEPGFEGVRDAFAEAVSRMPEVIEVWRVAGEADYLLKVVTRDMAAFDAFYRRQETASAREHVAGAQIGFAFD